MKWYVAFAVGLLMVWMTWPSSPPPTPAGDAIRSDAGRVKKTADELKAALQRMNAETRN